MSSWFPPRKYILVEEGSNGHAAAEQILDYMLQTAEASRLHWPSTPSEILTFTRAIETWCDDVRCFRVGQFGFVGGKGKGNDANHYLTKSYCRFVLHLTQCQLRDPFDEMEQKQLQLLLPDQNEKMASMGGRVLDVQPKLGVSGMLASCWLCLAGFLEDEGEQFIKASHEELRAIFERHLSRYMKRKLSGYVSATPPALISFFDTPALEPHSAP